MKKVYLYIGEVLFINDHLETFLSFLVLPSPFYLTLLLQLCSRIVEAQSPMAIVIPTKGSSFSTQLRHGDISWHDFLESAKDFKYIHSFRACYVFTFKYAFDVILFTYNC